MTPTSDGTSHIRPVLRGPKQRSLGVGKHSGSDCPDLVRNTDCHTTEGSAHAFKAESLVIQSQQDLPWARRTDRQCIHRLSSIMTAA